MAKEDAVSSSSAIPVLAGPGRAVERGRSRGARRARSTPLRSWARRAVVSRLEALDGGELELVDELDGGVRRFGRVRQEDPLRARVVVHDPRFYARLATGGSVGAGEAYAAGWWSTGDLPAVVRILARDARATAGLESGAARLAAAAGRGLQALRANSRAGSRRNIAGHYDLGNDFFSLFLDPSMMYSSAVYPRPESSLAEAARHKLDLVCDELELGPGDEVIEIGSGWGGFALHAARRHGCRVTTTTISRRQYEHTRARVRAAGLEDRIQVLAADYRDLPALCGRRFDKLVSIEMIEAVGHRHLRRYLEVVGELLGPSGLALLQAIIIPDQRYDAYRRTPDFIQRYIFPGGLVPSLGRIVAGIGTATDLELIGLEDITAHYARTLADWRRSFDAAADQLAELGFDDAFRRRWEFYFGYCEGGFTERAIGCRRLLFAKPGYRSGSSTAAAGSRLAACGEAR